MRGADIAPVSRLPRDTKVDRDIVLSYQAPHFSNGSIALNPTDFASLSLSPDLIAVTRELGFETLTPIQAQSIPVLLQGKDLIGQSKTGSGKTAAFTLPILQKVQVENRTIQSLILCPTRELCAQVAREIRRLGSRLKGLQVLILSGGQPIRPQLEALENGVHIVVGTPGRVLDHIHRGRLDLNDLKTLVLDEADRMLDMGFEDDMQVIMDEAPGTRQTVFFSATYPPSIKALSKKYQHSPVRVTIEESPESATSIQQFSYIAEPEKKLETLLKLLKQYQPGSAIVFCNQKISVTDVVDALARQGVSVDSLHGDLEQRDRDLVMAKFRNGSTRILIATDVAARGLDVENLDMVFNFDLPHQPEVYVHRIGRTGRAGNSGIAITLLTPHQCLRLPEFEAFPGVKFEQKTLSSAPASSPQRPSLHSGAPMQTLYIAGGRKQKVRPGDILGALTGEAGRLSAKDIGKIEIHDHFSYVAVATPLADTALQRLKNGRIKGQKFLIKFVK